MPKRIQLRRVKGWRKPLDAITVARPTAWGNPFRVGGTVDRVKATDRFREWLYDPQLLPLKNWRDLEPDKRVWAPGKPRWNVSPMSLVNSNLRPAAPPR